VGSENDGIEMNYSTKQTFIGEPWINLYTYNTNGFTLL
jgi:hypothetical protein